jgi:uncharacterized protein
LTQSKLRTITLEEHYATSQFMAGPGQNLKVLSRTGIAKLVDQLMDVDDKRVAEMTEANIDMQVLSLTSPGVEQLQGVEAVNLARDSNDALAKAVKLHPDRLAGFAAIPTPVLDKAADELERTVHEYGFKGALIIGHCRGRYLDDKFFWPIFERAQELNAKFVIPCMTYNYFACPEVIWIVSQGVLL